MSCHWLVVDVVQDPDIPDGEAERFCKLVVALVCWDASRSCSGSVSEADGAIEKVQRLPHGHAARPASCKMDERADESRELSSRVPDKPRFEQNADSYC